MKKLFKFSCFFISLFFTLFIKSFDVRILIDQAKIKNGIIWQLSASKNFLVSDLENTKRWQLIKSPKLNIGITGGKYFTINGKKINANFVKINTTTGYINFKDRKYVGYFFIYRDKHKVYLVNCLPLETYVQFGLRWEMMPYWPQSALETGAIAYRTYALSTILNTRKKLKREGKKISYDIQSTNINQVYKGVHDCDKVTQAVKNTRDIIITYDNKPIDARYDICCGGIIPAKRTGVDFEKAPYLKRNYACKFCKQYKYFNWEAVYTKAELGNLFKNTLNLRHPKPINNIKVASQDRSGFAQSLSVQINKKWIRIPMNKVFAVCKKLKSETFVIKNIGNKIKFIGKGYGHQLGLCQWGAYNLSTRGWSAKRILKFYYPKTILSKIEKLFPKKKLTKKNRRNSRRK